MEVKETKIGAIIVVILLMLIGCMTCRDTTESKKNTTSEELEFKEKPLEESGRIKLKEEAPPLATSSVNVGRLKMHQDGYSIGEKTEMTELQKQLQNKDADIIEITWIWDCSPKYDDMPMKIIYNKRKNVLQSIYTQNNVIEEFKNVSPECLEGYLKNGEKHFYALERYCKGVEYDFNNREMKIRAVGPKPEQSEWNGSVDIVKKYIKDNAHDASSIKFIEWSKVSHLDVYWIVRCKFKGNNALGVPVTTNAWFYIQNSKVVETKIIE